MIVVLDVEKVEKKGLWKTISSWYRPYEINVRIKKQNKISVLYLQYRQYRGAINYKKLYPYTIGYPKTILCDPQLNLEYSPFQRFHDLSFQRHMMENFVHMLLRRLTAASGSHTVCFYDPMGEFPLMAGRLLKELPTLTVLTDMVRFYEIESERVQEESGAGFIITNSPERLSDCQILISPKRIINPLPLTSGTIVFTTERPSVPVKGIVITEYHPIYPYQYRRLLPKGMDETLFLSALYSLCGIKDLSKLIPVRCSDGYTVFSPDQLLSQGGLLRKSPPWTPENEPANFNVS